MRKTLLTAACLTLGVETLAGCSGFIEAIEKSANYDDVVKIDYNLYKISGTRRNINQTMQLRDYLYQRAQDFCMRGSQGSQLLDGISGKTPDGGIKAEVVFRCVGIMKAPEEEFIDNSPEADAKRAEAARLAKEKEEEAKEAEESEKNADK